MQKQTIKRIHGEKMFEIPGRKRRWNVELKVGT